MKPEILNLIILLVQEVIKLEPAIQAELTLLFQKKDATTADWAAARQRILAKKYENYDPGFVPPTQA